MLICYACNKYKDVQVPAGSNPPEDKIVTASVQGRVLDENGDPVQGAAVTSGTASTTTDENGVFSFSNISMSSRFGFVKVIKDGYFTGSRSILTAASSSNFVTIALIPRAIKGTFGATSGGTVVVGASDTVIFDASSVVTAATNAAYTGTVHVYAYYLDPSATDAARHMPGDLRGIDTSGKEKLLQSFGMMIVELEGDGGEKLQIAPGKQASLSMKIPDALKAMAPASVPLWYFNDTTGKWIEQGIAVRKGGQLCGQTSHFTWWNCDMASSAVNYTVRLKDQHGNPLAYNYIRFKSERFLNTLGNYTDSAGVAVGVIPSGDALVLQVMNECGQMMAGANVGPALTDQNLGTITVDMSTSTITVTGKVVNCSDTPIDSGYVNVVVDGLSYNAAVRNGVFALPVSRCSSNSVELKVTAYDFVALKQSDVKTVSVNADNVDVGVLTICGEELGEFFSFTYNGTSRTFVRGVDSLQGSYYAQMDEPTIMAYGFQNGVRDSTNMQFVLRNVTAPGNYPIYYFSFVDVNLRSMNGVGATCTVTAYDAAGGYFSGTISGNLRDDYAIPAPTVLPITGLFRVKKTW